MFGAASSPTCANYALQRVGIDNKDQSPIAAKAIANNFYMDDFMKSFQTVEEGKQIFRQLQPLLSKYGFELKKWISNEESINELIPEDLRSKSAVKKIEIDPTAEDPSVLGLQWSIEDDTLQVCRGTKKEVLQPITQRKVLSQVSSVFDPIGLFAPFTVEMRRMLKTIWSKLGQQWDETIEPEYEKYFLEWKEQLPVLAETTIRRKYFNDKTDHVELHLFADASEHTMCAVAYLRANAKEQSAEVSFVIGKCRVAPMRHMSIPRLELQAAVMAVRLKEQIVKELEQPVHSFAYWSDSSTVIQWINSSHRKQQVFVANRVAEILDTTDVSQWKHVSGINNPADIGTRFITMEDLRQSEWLTGPAWLKESADNWPKEIPLIFAADDDNVHPSAFPATAKEVQALIKWMRFSNFNRLVNAVAYVKRAISKAKPTGKMLQTDEREIAKMKVFRLIH